MDDFIKKMDTSEECLKLFKHIILGSYFFKKNISECENCIITPKVDKNIDNMIITYFLNCEIKLPKTICYDWDSHFTIKSIDISKIVKITYTDNSDNPSGEMVKLPDAPTRPLTSPMPVKVSG
jgi:hypothetical protein